METGYSIKMRVETITANTRLTDTIYAGWMAVNIGTAAVSVYGVELLPGEGLDYTKALRPCDKWTEPIEVTVQPGGAVRMMRMLATPIK